jgi:hypothetical protein
MRSRPPVLLPLPSGAVGLAAEGRAAALAMPEYVSYDTQTMGA